MENPSEVVAEPPEPNGLGKSSKMGSRSSIVSFASGDLKSLKDIRVEWTGLNVFSDDSTSKGHCCNRTTIGPKHILKDVAGVAKPGQILAIMGASGAGKTTLLNVLQMQNTKDLIVDGSILVNGQSVGTAIRTISAYVQQEDLFVGTLTVREHLQFQAVCRMGKTFTKSERENRVGEILEELGLVKCADTVIGIKFGGRKGISGGERKRLAVASEMLNQPPITFCDEPISGLDAFMALQVIQVLKQIAARGKTVVCTIHQPSSQVFKMFDSICLLSEGRVAYFGPTQGAMSLYEKVGYPVPPNFNPADHFIRILAVVPGKEQICRQRIEAVCDGFQSSREHKQLKRIKETKGGGDDYEWDEFISAKQRYKASWIQQFGALSKRNFLANIRNPLLIQVRFIQTIMISLLLGLVYLQTGAQLCCLTIQNINGVLFLFLTNLTFPYVFGSIEVFCEELPIFLREHLSGLYRVDVYYLTKTMSELPQYIIFPFLFTVILYWMAGLPAIAESFFILCGINVLVANLAVSLGYFFSAACGSSSLALTISPIAVIPFMLFGGFFLNTATVPVYFVWLQYISYFKYAYEAIIVNQWRRIEVIPDCPWNNGTSACVRSGAGVLRTLNFNENNLMMDALILLGMIVIIRTATFIALLARSYRKN